MHFWEKEINKTNNAIETQGIGQLGLSEVFGVLPNFLMFL